MPFSDKGRGVFMHSLCVMCSMSLALQPFAVRAQMGS